MSIWKMEMERIRKLKKTIYKPPLPLKKQRVTARAQLPGKVKMFSEDEIFLFKVRKYRQSYV
ncbi:hypothetical protein KAW50_06540 [candidate division WOR-3 bacterium]|nr:hypothetical protein [candidate division WOR-3 bacterium]